MEYFEIFDFKHIWMWHFPLFGYYWSTGVHMCKAILLYCHYCHLKILFFLKKIPPYPLSIICVFYTFSVIGSPCLHIQFWVNEPFYFWSVYVNFAYMQNYLTSNPNWVFISLMYAVYQEWLWMLFLVIVIPIWLSLVMLSLLNY